MRTAASSAAFAASTAARARATAAIADASASSVDSTAASATSLARRLAATTRSASRHSSSASGLGLSLVMPRIVLRSLIGSVTQETMPAEIAAIHAGDWLAKLLIVAVIAALWR